MVLGYGGKKNAATSGSGSGDAHEAQMMASLRLMHQRSQALYETINVDKPSDLSILRLGSIGARSEGIRQAVMSAASDVRATKTLSAAQVNEITSFVAKNMVELIERSMELSRGLLRERCESLGMGFPTAVKMALARLRDAVKDLNEALEAACPAEQLEEVKEIDKRCLDPVVDTIKAYASVPAAPA
ncbi:hypothetical protein FA10DRAFT_60093 [Acaromyces ingoldii]|uniref:Uncharacterized protein n=1 Tax=Acaromyces ingoldii TaxID=215250 RepID=A0A316YPA0_9BASI|nr:hypothetical protein FA10DRAFT_60093 [Acaromyces ingoldii]PWN91109.1 hypothetical protein FA10DRAFT_60093 [Acaromyces ingoldii]